MNQDKHLTHYVMLFAGLSISVILLFVFRFNRPVQMMTGALGAAFYVSWGIIHHALEDRLTKAVIFEYLLFGALAFALLYFSSSV